MNRTRRINRRIGSLRLSQWQAHDEAQDKEASSVANVWHGEPFAVRLNALFLTDDLKNNARPLDCLDPLLHRKWSVHSDSSNIRVLFAKVILQQADLVADRFRPRLLFFC